MPNQLTRLFRNLLSSSLPQRRGKTLEGLQSGAPSSIGEPSAPDLAQAESQPWREAVGGMWEEIGRLQLDFMVRQGLRQHHRLLDIGCGSLRAGVRFVQYLDDGHYHGIDAQQWLLDAAVRVELPRADQGMKRVHLLCRDDFQFSEFGASFDFAIAQSVFTHLTWNSILRCLYNVRRVLNPDGRFFATFFEDSDGTHQASSILHSPGGIVTFPDQDPFHYPFAVFADLARRTGLGAEYIGQWDHPRGQMMMAFRRSRSD